MSNKMYIDGVLIVLTMAFSYLIILMPIMGHIVFVAYGVMGLVSRLFDPMNIAQIGVELGFLGVLLLATPDSMWNISIYFIGSYVVFAYIGAALNASYRYYVARRMTEEDTE